MKLTERQRKSLITSIGDTVVRMGGRVKVNGFYLTRDRIESGHGLVSQPYDSPLVGDRELLDYADALAKEMLNRIFG